MSSKSLSPVERIRQHCRDGKTQAYACDAEGVGPQTAADAIRGTGLKWAKPDRDYVPIGMAEPGVKPFLYGAGKFLNDLKARHSRYEICQLVGLTPLELTKAFGYQHNWTIAQLARLAKANNLSLDEVLTYSLERMRKEKRIGLPGG